LRSLILKKKIFFLPPV